MMGTGGLRSRLGGGGQRSGLTKPAAAILWFGLIEEVLVAPPFVRPKTLDRFVNPLLDNILVPLGLTPKRLQMLTVKGWRSGVARTRPVIVVERAGSRWLVALSGQSDWVRSVRADPRAQLRQGRRIEAVRLIEAGPEEGPAVVKAYVTEWKWNRRYFDHGPDDPQEAFAADIAVHPAFRVETI